MGSPPHAHEQPHPPPPQELAEGSQRDAQSTLPPPPAAPVPESDAGIVPDVTSPILEDDNLLPENIDIFTLTPVAALRLLCRNVDTIIHVTGDVPPTPPASSPMRPMSVPNIHRKSSVSTSPPPKDAMSQNLQIPVVQGSFTHEQIDGVPFKRAPIGSPDSGLWEPHSPEHQDVGYNAPSAQIQYSALARKFYSKRPPPIAIEDYLLRMHKYCPMSTAVYLAASCYVTRLACIDKIVSVTPRNVHRLLLAGLRVAMKALEDLSWPHARFAKVGGVNEAELSRLEVTFCFLMDFGLKVDSQMLQMEAQNICRAVAVIEASTVSALDEVRKMELKIPDGRIKSPQSGVGSGMHTPSRTPEKRKASSALPNRPAFGVGTGGIEVMGQS